MKFSAVKKRDMFLGVLLIVTLLSVFTQGCGQNIDMTPGSSNANISNVDKITIFCRLTGEFVEVVDDEQINHITTNLTNLVFNKDKPSKIYDNFLYYIKFCDSNGKKLDDVIIMSDTRICYKDYFYDVADERKIDVAIIGELFDNKETNVGDFVEAGLYYSDSNSEPTPWLATAIKAKKTQESVVNFTIYAGYQQGFIDKWNNDAWKSNPGYGVFAMERVICDRNGTVISSNIFQLNDFECENNYLVRAVSIAEGTDAVTFRDFSFHFEDELDIDEFAIDQGYIFYRIILVDGDNKIIVTDFNCGESAIDLYFKKVADQITFSLYDSILYE